MLQAWKSKKGDMRKQSNKYIGPYFVESLLPNSTLRLRDANTGRVLRSAVHYDRVKPCYSSRFDFDARNQYDRHRPLPVKQTQGTITSSPLPTQDTTEGLDDTIPTPSPKELGETANTNPTPNSDSEWVEIRKILKHKKVGTVMKFLVEWKDGSASWCKRSDVTPIAIEAYWLEKGVRATKRRKRRKQY